MQATLEICGDSRYTLLKDAGTAALTFQMKFEFSDVAGCSAKALLALNGLGANRSRFAGGPP